MRYVSHFIVPPKDAERPQSMGGNGMLPRAKGDIQPTVPAEYVPKPRDVEPTNKDFDERPLKVEQTLLSGESCKFSDEVNESLAGVDVVDIQSLVQGNKIVLVIVYREKTK